MLDQERLKIQLSEKNDFRLKTGSHLPTYHGDMNLFQVSYIAAPRVSVIVPALNEAENLPYVLPLIPTWVYEVILVDGFSKDNTIEVAKELLPDIRIVMQEGRGKGAALRTGFAAANGDIIVMLDADGSTDPLEIPGFIGALMSGADFAKGSRFLQGGGSADITPLRNLGNIGLLLLTRLFFGGRYTDLCYGYNAFWRRVLPKLNLNTTGFEIETEMNIHALRSKLRVAEVGCFEAKRIYGQSNLNTFRDGFRVLKTILREARAEFLSRTRRAGNRNAETEYYQRQDA